MPGQCSALNVFYVFRPTADELYRVYSFINQLPQICDAKFSYLQHYQYNNVLVLLSIVLLHFPRFTFKTSLNMLFINNLVAPKYWEKPWRREMKTTKTETLLTFAYQLHTQSAVESLTWWWCAMKSETKTYEGTFKTFHFKSLMSF